MTASRRLAAILAADVAGYSRLMGADEEGTLERLKALRRELVELKIAEHHVASSRPPAMACSWQKLTSTGRLATRCCSDQLKGVGEDWVMKHVVNRPHRCPGYRLT
jgi:class 3 adenylate cyclase